jgi:hypothetical protein
MRIFTCIVSAFLFFSASWLPAQDITYSKSVFDETGEPTTMVTPEVSFLNTGPDSIEVFVRRIYMNLPVNWTSCFCFISCHPPTDDTLRFFLAPMEKAYIGVGFNTDSIPGIGYVKITVEQIGGTQKDTLSFSGSTMMAGINESFSASSVKVFPNPASDKLIIQPLSQDKYDISVSGQQGEVVKYENAEGRSELNLKGFPAGIYNVTINYKSGKTETKRIIKTN